MSVTWQNHDNRIKDSVTKVIENVVRNDNGKDLLYQCHPAIHDRRAQTVIKQNHDNLTVGDILQRLRKTKQMTHMVLMDH
jgi:hypothetical protein